jgi:hypothetical protein
VVTATGVVGTPRLRDGRLGGGAGRVGAEVGGIGWAEGLEDDLDLDPLR